MVLSLTSQMLTLNWFFLTTNQQCLLFGLCWQFLLSFIHLAENFKGNFFTPEEEPGTRQLFSSLAHLLVPISFPLSHCLYLVVVWVVCLNCCASCPFVCLGCNDIHSYRRYRFSWVTEVFSICDRRSQLIYVWPNGYLINNWFNCVQISYWRQYEQGMLSFESVQRLLDNLSVASQEPTVEKLLLAEKIEKYTNYYRLDKIFHLVTELHALFKNTFPCLFCSPFSTSCRQQLFHIP